MVWNGKTKRTSQKGLLWHQGGHESIVTQNSGDVEIFSAMPLRLPENLATISQFRNINRQMFTSLTLPLSHSTLVFLYHPSHQEHPKNTDNTMNSSSNKSVLRTYRVLQIGCRSEYRYVIAAALCEPRNHDRKNPWAFTCTLTILNEYFLSF